MRKIYFACVRECGEKSIAFVVSCSPCDNVVRRLEGIKIAHLCRTKKEADAIVYNWNVQFFTDCRILCEWGRENA